MYGSGSMQRVGRLECHRGNREKVVVTRGCAALLEDEGIEVALDNHVLYRSHCDLEQIGVCRIRIVDIDLFLRLPYEVTELVCEELHAGFDIGGRSCVVGKDFADGTHAACDLFSEKINLVQEQNQSRLLKIL
jgi:hypothetical protein